jgi:hypothetical protein
VEKYSRAAQATDNKMADAFFMLDTQGYKHTLRTCHSYCFSAPTIVARKRPNVTFICTLSVTLILLTTKYYSGDQIKGDEMGVYFNLQWRHGEFSKKFSRET